MGTANVRYGIDMVKVTSSLQACSLGMRSSAKILYFVDSLCEAHQTPPEVHALLKCNRPNVLVE
jgi:hypothetical protein